MAAIRNDNDRPLAIWLVASHRGTIHGSVVGPSRGAVAGDAHWKLTEKGGTKPLTSIEPGAASGFWRLPGLQTGLEQQQRFGGTKIWPGLVQLVGISGE